MKTTNNLVTKDYLDKKLKSFKTEIKEELVEMKDEIVSELKAMREEFTAHQFLHQTANDTLDDHEKRLRKLEKPAL